MFELRHSKTISNSSDSSIESEALEYSMKVVLWKTVS